MEKDSVNQFSMPFKVYEEMGVMSHSRYIGITEDIELIRQSCRDGIIKYFEDKL